VVSDVVEMGEEGEITATMMAGFVAILAGREMYIWMLVGLVPKFVTCWRAALAVTNRAEAVVRTFMVTVESII
jgi:hypothetical protein